MNQAFTRVLLADGVTAMRDVHRYHLRNAGLHNVVEATTSDDALVRVRRQAFGLIVWALPLDRAFDELVRSRSSVDGVQVPIIVLLGHAETWLDTGRHPNLAVLRKPVNTASLRTAAEGMAVPAVRQYPAREPEDGR